jgi:hypothetical protein
MCCHRLLTDRLLNESRLKKKILFIIGSKYKMGADCSWSRSTGLILQSTTSRRWRSYGARPVEPR